MPSTVSSIARGSTSLQVCVPLESKARYLRAAFLVRAPEAYLFFYRIAIKINRAARCVYASRNYGSTIQERLHTLCKRFIETAKSTWPHFAQCRAHRTLGVIVIIIIVIDYCMTSRKSKV